MPTRYTLDVDLIVTLDALQSKDKKVTSAKEAKARFEERFKTGGFVKRDSVSVELLVCSSIQSYFIPNFAFHSSSRVLVCGAGRGLQTLLKAISRLAAWVYALSCFHINVVCVL
ncbi:hypothetical protein Scep_027714 [Stephania cephalantha]|uniref:Uncharacterized protein n=1 Tax=Stephania cephalantha TaxID=152367 RepID=A0AAP0HL21_9MAGN